MTGLAVTFRFGQPDRARKDLGGQRRIVRIEQRPTQIAVSRGVFGFEFDGALQGCDGFRRSSHFDEGAPQTQPAALVARVALEELAESSCSAQKDVWVAVGQLGKVTEVPSARPASSSGRSIRLANSPPGRVNLLGHSVKGD